MNWEAIGAVGEIVGAAAVVLTLLYLARETRKNAHALDATSSSEFGIHLSEWHREAARDPDVKRILLKSAQPEMEEYSGAEWFEFRALAISLFLIYQTTFIHRRLDVGSREESENYVLTARGLLDSFPAWRRFWEEEASTGTFTRGFVDAINAASTTQNFQFFAEAKIP